MNELQIFKSPEFGEIRTVTKDGQPWFVAADVCRALEHSNVTVAIERLDEDEKAKLNLGLRGGDTGCVNEAGLYALVLGSRKPEAKAFKRWITHDVIPAIRKHGGYLTPEKVEEALLNPDTIIKLATSLKEERAARLAAESQIEQDKPKVLFADSVAASKSSILVGELAKLIKQNGVNMGANRLFDWMRKNKYLCSKGDYYNVPTQRSMEMGLFEIKETVINHPDGSAHTSRTTKVTGKGQQYFINIFLSKGDEPHGTSTADSRY